MQEQNLHPHDEKTVWMQLGKYFEALKRINGPDHPSSMPLEENPSLGGNILVFLKSYTWLYMKSDIPIMIYSEDPVVCKVFTAHSFKF